MQKANVCNFSTASVPLVHENIHKIPVVHKDAYDDRMDVKT